MPIKPRKLIIPALVTVALLGTVTIARAAHTGTNLEFQPLLRLGGFDRGAYLLKIDLRITNPTGGKLTITEPYLKISVNGSKLAENTLSNRRIKIEPRRTIRLRDTLGDDLTIRIEFQNALTVLGPAVGQLVAGTRSEIPVEIFVSTTAFVPGIPAGIPVEVTEHTAIKSPRA